MCNNNKKNRSTSTEKRGRKKRRILQSVSVVLLPVSLTESRSCNLDTPLRNLPLLSSRHPPTTSFYLSHFLPHTCRFLPCTRPKKTPRRRVSLVLCGHLLTQLRLSLFHSSPPRISACRDTTTGPNESQTKWQRFSTTHAHARIRRERKRYIYTHTHI